MNLPFAGHDRVLSRLDASTRSRSLCRLSENAEQCRLCPSDGESIHAGFVAVYEDSIDCQCLSVRTEEERERERGTSVAVVLERNGSGYITVHRQ